LFLLLLLFLWDGLYLICVVDTMLDFCYWDE
jgi:hypothetical protein